MNITEKENEINFLIETCNSLHLETNDSFGGIKEINDQRFSKWKTELLYFKEQLTPKDNAVVLELDCSIKSLIKGWTVEKDLKNIAACLETIKEHLTFYFSRFNEKKYSLSKVDLVNSTKVLADTNSGFTGKEIIELTSAYSEDFGVALPFYEYPTNVPITKSELLKSNLEPFSSIQKVYIICEMCRNPKFIRNEKVQYLLQNIIEKYGEIESVDVNNERILIDKTSYLQKYAKSYDLFNKAVTSYNENNIDRSTLDNARLSLELLVKEILKNEKSLENQKGELLAYLKTKNVSSYIRNVFWQILDLYSKYQNENIKHEDKVCFSEVKYILDLTQTMMAFLIKTCEI